MTTSKINIELPAKHSLDEKAITDAGFGIVYEGDLSIMPDFAFAWKMPSARVPVGKTVLYQSEPPVSGERIALYGMHEKFLGVFCYTPFLANEYPITDTVAYPYPPAYSLAEAQKKPVGTRRNTGIYFAGKCSGVLEDGAYFNGYRQYQFREDCARRLRDALGGECVGEGWERKSKDDWHRRKMDEIAFINPDYVLCFENCRMPNYVSEKFMDGLLSGRLALYYGAQNVEQMLDYQDAPSFVNLEDFTDWQDEVPVMDIERVAEYLSRMTDEEYKTRVRNQFAIAEEHRGVFETIRRNVTLKGLELITKAV